MDGADWAIVATTVLVPTLGVIFAFGKVYQRQTGQGKQLDDVDLKMATGFTVLHTKVDNLAESNGSEHKSISKDIGKGNERIARIEGRLNGSPPPT